MWCDMIRFTIPHYTMLYDATLCCTMQHNATQCLILLCSATPFHAFPIHLLIWYIILLLSPTRNPPPLPLHSLPSPLPSPPSSTSLFLLTLSSPFLPPLPLLPPPFLTSLHYLPLGTSPVHRDSTVHDLRHYTHGIQGTARRRALTTNGIVSSNRESANLSSSARSKYQT